MFWERGGKLGRIGLLGEKGDSSRGPKGLSGSKGKNKQQGIYEKSNGLISRVANDKKKWESYPKKTNSYWERAKCLKKGGRKLYHNLR